MSRGAASTRWEGRPDTPLARVQSLAQEHGVLVRTLGALQRRVGQLQHAHAQALGELQGEVMRLRAQLVAARTRVLWGLPAGGDLAPGARAVVDATPRPTARTGHPPQRVATGHLAAAQAVICQTGCVGHAHPWREADGQCRRMGQACDTARAGSTAEPQPADPGR